MATTRHPPLDLRGVDLAAFCRRHFIIRLSVFGSVARGEDTPESDLDILVEFAPGKTPGFDFIGIEEELTHLFGRRVDLNTSGFINRRFRAEVLREAVPLYEDPARPPLGGNGFQTEAPP